MQQCQDPVGSTVLYELVHRVAGPYVRQLGHDAKDCLHDVYIDVMLAVKRDSIRDRDRLPGFIKTIARRTVCSYICRTIRDRHNSDPAELNLTPSGCPNPEEEAAEAEEAEIVIRVLRATEARDRDVMFRRLCLGQEAKQVCCETGLSYSQYAQIKTVALRRLQERLTRRLGRGGPAKPNRGGRK
jgi:RNA polymerase sigma-70 factor, ECF subfamily